MISVRLAIGDIVHYLDYTAAADVHLVGEQPEPLAEEFSGFKALALVRGLRYSTGFGAAVAYALDNDDGSLALATQHRREVLHDLGGIGSLGAVQLFKALVEVGSNANIS